LYPQDRNRTFKIFSEEKRVLGNHKYDGRNKTVEEELEDKS